MFHSKSGNLNQTIFRVLGNKKQINQIANSTNSNHDVILKNVAQMTEKINFKENLAR